jgi:hypothetical protein
LTGGGLGDDYEGIILGQQHIRRDRARSCGIVHWDDNPSTIDLLSFDAVVAPVEDQRLEEEGEPEP